MLSNWEVEFKGDSWRLIVTVEHRDNDLAGLIDKAIQTARGGDCPIDLQGYYEVSEVRSC